VLNPSSDFLTNFIALMLQFYLSSQEGVKIRKGEKAEREKIENYGDNRNLGTVYTQSIPQEQDLTKSEGKGGSPVPLGACQELELEWKHETFGKKNSVERAFFLTKHRLRGFIGGFHGMLSLRLFQASSEFSYSHTTPWRTYLDIVGKKY